MAQFLQMKGKCRRRRGKLFAELPGGQTLRPGLHQQAENIEPRFLGQSSQRGQGFVFFYISIFMKI